MRLRAGPSGPIRVLPRAALPAVALVAVALPAAGCGGDDDGQATGPRTTTTAKTSTGAKRTTTGAKKADEDIKDGTYIRNFQAQVTGNGVRLTATLTRPAGLSLAVRKIGGKGPIELGSVGLGRRSGQVAIDWNLVVRGRRVGPGRYRLRLLGGKTVGRSQADNVTLPSTLSQAAPTD